jgi:uncharacterized protein
MPKSIVLNGVKVSSVKRSSLPEPVKNTSESMVFNHFMRDIRQQEQQLVMNFMTSRLEWMRKASSEGKDIDEACDYPDVIGISDYKEMYSRFGPASRVVSLLPSECWATEPDIYQDENPSILNPFEKAFRDLDERVELISFMERIDEMSGLGRFGILLLGLSDGKLEQPAPGIDRYGKRIDNFANTTELLFIRAFDESSVEIKEFETDRRNPRYGQPKIYNLAIAEPTGGEVMNVKDQEVHWTRVIHVADGCRSSEVYGIPRMKPVFNTLLDLKKVLGGSAEMFWKGAFPGFSFETHPPIPGEEPLEIDVDSVREQFRAYQDGLERFLALENVTAKQLAPQVSNPQNHVMALMQFIALTLGVPLRVLLGSESGSLASDQDQTTWNMRVSRRQRRYVIPRIIRRTINHLQLLGVMPAGNYKVHFPELHTPSRKDKATISKTLMEAMARYVATGAERMMPPYEFLVFILGFTREEADVIMEAAKKYEVEWKKRQQEELKMQQAMSGVQNPTKGATQPKGGAKGRGKTNPAGGAVKSNRGKAITVIQ